MGAVGDVHPWVAQTCISQASKQPILKQLLALGACKCSPAIKPLHAETSQLWADIYAPIKG